VLLDVHACAAQSHPPYLFLQPLSMANIAIIGGGLGGSLCALALRSRGLNATIFDAGRALGGRSARSQFLASSEPHLDQVISTLSNANLIKPWTGRFGVMGAKGGFLPLSSISTAMAGTKNESPTATPTTDTGDFCGFLAHARSPIYVGTPNNSSLCTSICELVDVKVHLESHVSAATHVDGKWMLQIKGGGISEAFDGVVFASHNQTLAADAIKTLSSPPDQPEIKERLDKLSTSLGTLRSSHTSPVFTVSLQYPPAALNRVNFDAATLPADPALQMLIRESSKPGRDVNAPHDEWTGISTTVFAKVHLESEVDMVTEMMVRSTARVLAPYFGNDEKNVPTPIEARAKRWGAAFTTAPLIPSTEPGEDCVGLEPWRMVIAGDYVQVKQSPGEAMAMSGLVAGEKMASWFAGDTTKRK